MHRQYRRSVANADRLVHILDTDAATCRAMGIVFRLEGFHARFSTDADHFFAAFEREPADVVVANLRLGGGDGLAVLRRLEAYHGGVAVFALTDSGQVDAAVMAMRAGAIDVLTRPYDIDRLVRGVHEALRDFARVPFDHPRRRAGPNGAEALTPRERQVLLLIAEGASNKEAGRELGISPRTVEVHRARVMAKLGARNAAELARFVLGR